MAIKLLVVDDHQMVIEGLRTLLGNSPRISWVGAVGNASSCLDFLERNEVDVILMDIQLPDVNGISLCRQVKEKFPRVFVVGLSSYDHRKLVEDMVTQGASGYLLKNASRVELITCVELVSAGGTYFSWEVDPGNRKVAEEEIPVLTKREKMILDLLAKGHSNKRIAADLFISAPTVDSHRMNLLRKFQVHNVAALIHRASELKFLDVNGGI